MRSPKNKLYVNIKTGVVYHKPVKVNGIAYEPPKDFYEINEAQAARISAGEPVRSVLREGIREKVEAELEAMIPEAPAEAPAEAPEADEEEDKVEAMSTHREINAYAAAKGLEIPSECTTVQSKKDFINTALLVS